MTKFNYQNNTYTFNDLITKTELNFDEMMELPIINEVSANEISEGECVQCIKRNGLLIFYKNSEYNNPICELKKYYFTEIYKCEQYNIDDLIQNYRSHDIQSCYTFIDWINTNFNIYEEYDWGDIWLIDNDMIYQSEDDVIEIYIDDYVEYCSELASYGIDNRPVSLLNWIESEYSVTLLRYAELPDWVME